MLKNPNWPSRKDSDDGHADRQKVVRSFLSEVQSPPSSPSYSADEGAHYTGTPPINHEVESSISNGELVLDTNTPHGAEGVEEGAPPKKKAKRNKKVKKGSLGDIADVGTVQAAPSSSSKSGPKMSKKTEVAVQQFMQDVLPTLRKEILKKKPTSFDMSSIQDYFVAGSKVKPTYLLPLFHFLNKNEVVCNRYGVFDGRHMIKTTDGFNHVMTLSKYADLSPDETDFITRRFGKEWHKIPAKDQYKVQTAMKTGFNGLFKIILVGVYEDSFRDEDKGEEIFIVNPILKYEPVRALKPASEKVEKIPKESDTKPKKRTRAGKEKKVEEEVGGEAEVENGEKEE